MVILVVLIASVSNVFGQDLKHTDQDQNVQRDSKHHGNSGLKGAVSHAERRILLSGSMGRKARKLYVLGTDRTTLVNLMPPEEKGGVVRASWSPDGTKIAFILKFDVYIVNSDGTGHINVTNSADLHEDRVFWSPDGTQILFEAVEYIKVDGKNKNKNAMFIVNADGSNKRQVSPWDTWQNLLSWSNDGERIFYTSTEKKNTADRSFSDNDIYSMKLDGTDRINLTNRDGYEEFLKELSDGRIMFLKMNREGDGPRYELYTVESDGSSKKMVGSFKYPATEFSLSPDETQIAFRTRTKNDSGDISIADVDGSNQRVVLSTEMDDIKPVWSPDGKKIVFAKHKGDHIYSLMMMNADGTGVERLVPDLKSAMFLEFEPKETSNMSRSPFPLENEKEERITKVADLNGDFENGTYVHSSGAKMPLLWDGIGGTLHYQNDGSNGYLVLGNPTDTWSVAHTMKPPVPLDKLGLNAGQAIAISADIIKLKGDGHAELKLEQYKDGGKAANGVTSKEIVSTDSWETYRANFTIKPNTDSVVFVIVAVEKGASYGFDNVVILPEAQSEKVIADSEKQATLASLSFYKDYKIAFASKRGKVDRVSSDIYTMNPDGSGLENLTDNGLRNVGPSWSPDGKKIGFSSYREGDGDINWDIYIMSPDGSEQKRVTSHLGRDYMGSWSPDGNKIAFYSERTRNPEVHVIDIDGNNESGLSLNPHWDGDPSWSPDGKGIAFASDRDGKMGIYIMTPNGKSQEMVTDTSNQDSSPCWSPDGRKIAFVSKRDGNREIYVMNSDGTEQKRLTNNSVIDSDPAWSPDGQKIIFRSERDGNSEIYIMNADGSNPINITNNSAYDFAPSWSPLPLEYKMISSIKPPYALVKKEVAEFQFYINNIDQQWSWGDSIDNALEYSWMVEIHLMDKVYELGYSYFKPPGGKSDQGTLQELLSKGQVDIWCKGKRVLGGPAVFKDLGISVKQNEQGLLIRLIEPKFLNAILSERPESVIFKSKGWQQKKDKKNKKEEIKVKYQLNDLK